MTDLFYTISEHQDIVDDANLDFVSPKSSIVNEFGVYDSYPKGKVTVEISHPDLFQLDGLEEFKKMPFLRVNPKSEIQEPFSDLFEYQPNIVKAEPLKQTLPTMTANGVTVRDENGVTRRPFTKDQYGGWYLSYLSLRPKSDSYVPKYEDNGSFILRNTFTSSPWRSETSGFGIIIRDAKADCDFASLTIRNDNRYTVFVGAGVDGGEFFVPKTFDAILGTSMQDTFLNGSPNKEGNWLAVRPPILKDESDKQPQKDFCSFLFDIGDVYYAELEINKSTNEISGESVLVASDVWVKIVIPIDVDGAGGEVTEEGQIVAGAPSIPTFPNPFANVNAPDSPGAALDMAANLVAQTTTTPINKFQHTALVAAAAIMGPVAYKSSRLFALLNSGDVLAAAEAIADLSTYTDLKLDSDDAKALAEAKRIHSLLAPYKDVFLQGGYLDELGEYRETPQSIEAMSSQPGYVGTPPFKPNDPVGFSDPGKKYPRPSTTGEPDTNRLSRQERTRATPLYKKEQARHRGVIKANQGGTWDQPRSGYNSQYPYNHLTQTESGHLFELDDTPGSERINLQHRTGTFIEVDNTGTQVRRTVGDDYTILERDGKVHIIGNADVTIGGATRVRVENTFDLEVHGATNINIYNNANVKVSGDVNMKVSGGVYAAVAGQAHVTSVGNMNLTTMSDMFFKSKGAMRFDAGDGFSVHSGNDVRIGSANEIFVNGTKTYLQSGGADGNAIVPNIEIEKDPIFTPRNVVLPPLAPFSRAEADAAVFESPDEGTQAQVDAWKNKRSKEGTASSNEMNAEPKIEKKESAQTGKDPEHVDIQVPQGREFRADDKLSKYFTLADLTANYSRKLTDRFGNTAEQKFKNLAYLCTNALDIVKKEWPSMKISSGLRDFVPPGGTTKSQHLTGEAVDVQFPGLDRKGLVERAKQISGMIPYDQMLLEFNTPGGNGWIHISLKPSPRKQAFTMNNHKKVSGDGEFVLVA